MTSNGTIMLFLSALTAQYFASTMMIVGMSVVVTVIVLQFHHHDPHGGKMPKWVSVIDITTKTSFRLFGFVHRCILHQGIHAYTVHVHIRVVIICKPNQEWRPIPTAGCVNAAF